MAKRGELREAGQARKAAGDSPKRGTGIVLPLITGTVGLSALLAVIGMNMPAPSERVGREAEGAANGEKRAAARAAVREAALAPLRSRADSDNARIKTLLAKAQAAADAEDWDRCLSELDKINPVTKAYSTANAEDLVDIEAIRRAQALAEQARTAVRDAKNAAATIGVSNSDLRKWTKGCRRKDIIRDEVDGRPRFMCTMKRGSMAYMVEMIGNENDLRKVTIMQGVGGDPLQMLDQLMNPVEMFQTVAGAKVGEFMPEGWLRKVVEGKTAVDYQGRRYTTNSLPELGMIAFTVSPATDD